MEKTTHSGLRRHHSRFEALLWGWDAHHRFIFSCLVGLAALFLMPSATGWAVRGVFGWDAFCLSTLLLAWVAIVLKDPYEARRSAKLQDSSRTFLFVIVVTAATASLVGVGLLLEASKASGITTHSLEGHIALALAAIFLSWALIHTLFTLRYAHYYYRDAHSKAREHVEGGIDFPGKSHPDYLDFAYFSFVIGMTAQVSDVTISSRRVRRVALVHGLISFLFNTAILAIFVNIVAGLL